MSLFSRSVLMTGPATAVAEFALGVREYVTKKIGTEVSLWSMQFGGPVGTMVYSVRVDGHAGLAAITAPLVDDSKYEAMLTKGAEFLAGPPVDMLREPLDGASGGDPPPLGAVAVITTAIIGNGKYAEAIGWGLDTAAHATKVSGMPVAFYSDLYGPFGQVTWIGVSPDMASLDAANAKINSDAAYIGKLSAAGDLFVPGAAHRAMAVRVG
jgi:hypothetical protein